MSVVIWAWVVSTRVTRGIVVAVSFAITAMCVAMSWAVLASMGTIFIRTISVVIGTMLAVGSLVKSVMILGFLKKCIKICFENGMFHIISSLTPHFQKSGMKNNWGNTYLIITLAIVLLAVLSIVAVMVSGMAVVGPMMAAVVSTWMNRTMLRSPVTRRRWRVVGWIYSQIWKIDIFRIHNRAFVV